MVMLHPGYEGRLLKGHGLGRKRLSQSQQYQVSIGLSCAASLASTPSLLIV